MSDTQEELIRAQERNVAHQIAALISKRYPQDTICIKDTLATTEGPRVMSGDLGFVWRFDCYGSLGKIRFNTAENEWQAYWYVPDIYPE